MTSINCTGPLAEHVSRDNTALKNVRIIRLSRPHVVTHPYSYNMSQAHPNLYFLIAERMPGKFQMVHLSSEFIDDLDAIKRHVSDVETTWYETNREPEGEYLSIPFDVEVGGDNDVNQ